MKTNMENYEERFVDYMEGQLDATEMKEVETFVALHPELEEDFKLFCASKLKSDETIVFDKKEDLIRGATIIRPLFVKIMAAAACVALLIGAGICFLHVPQTRDPQPLLSSLNPVKASPLETHPAAMQLKNSTIRQRRIPQPVPERQELEAIASLDLVIPTQLQWNGTVVYDHIDGRMIKELDDRIAMLEPFDDLDASEEDIIHNESEEAMASLQDRFVGNARQLGRNLYKRTAKTVMTAYYTADSYLDEAVERLK